MGKRLIATGVTNSQGQVAIPYTGVGAGKLQLVAELEDGTLSSETYELYDVLFKDTGDKTWTNESNVTISAVENGRTITSTNGTGLGVLFNTFNENNAAIEFDLTIEYTTSFNLIAFRQGSAVLGQIPVQRFVTSGESAHVRITVTDGNVRVYIDDVENTHARTTLTSATWNRFYLQVGATASVTYKNLIVYPI